MNAPPFLSIVIPTRDRPQLLKHALWSALNQSDQDFEVIVCDNPGGTPARSAFDEIVGNHPCFRYVRPETDLNMVDNWNFAASHATGDYITILEDKFALHLDCVEALKKVVQNEQPEIVSWYADVFRPEDEDRGCEKGTYLQRNCYNLEPCSVDPFSVIEKRLTHDFSRGSEGGMYGMGKIVFGAYHKNLIERIVKHTGRLFHPFAPDYSSMTAALLLADSAIDMGRSNCVAVSSTLSNGNLCQRHVHHAEKFFSTFGDLKDTLEQLPIRNLPTPCHNIVAHAYLSLCLQLPEMTRGKELNWAGLYLQCERELDLVEWKNEEEKREHYDCLEASALHFPFKHRIALKIRKALSQLPKPYRNRFATMSENYIFKLEGTPSLRADSKLWKRWATVVGYHESPISSIGLNASLLYLHLRNHLPPSDPLHPTPKLSMNSGKLDIPSSIEEKIQNLDPDISSLLNAILAQIAEYESDSKKKELDNKISELEDKLKNFRGMITRRDERILKLERKLSKKK